MDQSFAKADARLEKRLPKAARGSPRPCFAPTSKSAPQGSEPAKAVLEVDGTVSLHIGTQSTGQGHRTAYAQFVAGPLGLDYEKIRVVQGDSDALPTGGGTGGSRSIPLGAPSVDQASRTLADQIKSIAADELEAGVGDIELIDGTARVVGTDRSLSYPISPKGEGQDQAHRHRRIQDGRADLPERDACLRGRDRPRDRPHGSPAIHDGRRLRRDGESHAPGRPGHGAWRSPSARRCSSIPITTPTAARDGDLQRLRHARADDFRTSTSIRGTCRASGTCSASRRRRGRHHRSHAGGDERRVDALHRAYGIRNIDMPATPLRIWEAIRAVRS